MSFNIWKMCKDRFSSVPLLFIYSFVQDEPRDNELKFYLFVVTLYVWQKVLTFCLFLSSCLNFKSHSSIISLRTTCLTRHWWTILPSRQIAPSCSAPVWEHPTTTCVRTEREVVHYNLLGKRVQDFVMVNKTPQYKKRRNVKPIFPL